METRIRPARPQDLPAIVEIFNQGIQTRTSTGYLTPVTIADRQAWFLNHAPDQFPLLVAEHNNQVIGYVSLEPYRPGRDAFRQTTEASLFIHEDHRRRGIGSQLLSTALSTACTRGFTVILAIILDQNQGSIRLLEKHGFIRWGRLPGIATIDGRTFDHLYYGRHLTPE
jgi:L-amino acid N-acyltransferase YncA